jgi:hypothetical protein
MAIFTLCRRLQALSQFIAFNAPTFGNSNVQTVLEHSSESLVARCSQWKLTETLAT